MVLNYLIRLAAHKVYGITLLEHPIAILFYFFLSHLN